MIYSTEIITFLRTDKFFKKLIESSFKIIYKYFNTYYII